MHSFSTKSLELQYEVFRLRMEVEAFSAVMASHEERNIELQVITEYEVTRYVVLYFDIDLKHSSIAFTLTKNYCEYPLIAPKQT